MAQATTDIGGVQVPAEYVQDVQDAATALGIPASIVANQINLESSFNPNATSPTGAEGLAQFEPYTFKDLGISGSPYTPSVAFQAYVKYMGELLKQEKGDIWSALEAYNAGPGNLGAGNSYAATIFSRSKLFRGAKQGGTGKVTFPTGTGAPGGGQGAAGQQSTGNPQGGWSNAIGNAWSDITGGLLTWPGVILGAFDTMDHAFADVYKGLELFFQPSTWVRAGAGLFGFIFIIVGIICLAREAKSS